MSKETTNCICPASLKAKCVINLLNKMPCLCFFVHFCTYVGPKYGKFKFMVGFLFCTKNYNEANRVLLFYRVLPKSFDVL